MRAIGTITIRQQGDLYNLNDLHKAAGREDKHRPAFFLRNEQTQALIQELQSAQICAVQPSEAGNCANLHSLENAPVLQTIEGRNGGTFACRELVIAYAAWISPAFHLRVLRVFLAHTAQTPDTSIGQKSLGWVHSRPVPRLHFQQPPPVGCNRAGGRTIEAAKAISRAIEDWAGHLPDERAAHELQHAAQTLHALLVTGWTEVDEALSMLGLARHYLNRWQGRGGAVGNIR